MRPVVQNRLSSLRDRFDDISTQNWVKIDECIDDENDFTKTTTVRKELKDILDTLKPLQQEMVDIRKFIKNNFPSN